MFLGHYMAWIAAALLLAALIKMQPLSHPARWADDADSRHRRANPGLLAFQSLGWAGHHLRGDRWLDDGEPDDLSSRAWRSKACCQRARERR